MIEKLPDAVGGFTGCLMVVSACGDSDYEIVFFYDTGKIKITFVFVTADIDGDPHAFAYTVNIFIGLVVIGGGDDQVSIIDVFSLVLLFQDPDLSLGLQFQKLRIDLGCDDISGNRYKGCSQLW